MIINIEDCIKIFVKFLILLYCVLCGIGFIIFLYIYGGDFLLVWIYVLLFVIVLIVIIYLVIIVWCYKV